MVVCHLLISVMGTMAHRAEEIKTLECKILRVSTKNAENFENFQENFEIFSDQNPYGKLTFSQFFPISWSSASSLKVYTLGR